MDSQVREHVIIEFKAQRVHFKKLVDAIEKLD